MRSWLLARTHGVWLCAGAAALALAGCSSSATAGSSPIVVKGNTLTVYASQPPSGSGGQPAADMLDAEQLALAQAGGKAGRYALKLVKLDGHELSDNARKAIEDPTAIAYLGELQPGTSQIPVEITNQQGLLVVSPADTAVYLTQPVPPVSSSPTSFYPAHSTYKETFARVVPNTASEARALASEMQSEGVSRLYLADDGSQYGAAVTQEVAHDAKAAGITLVSGAAAADGAFYGGSIVSPTARAVATRALDGVASRNPSAKLFAPSGLYNNSFVAGLSPGAQQQLYVSSPGFLPRDLPSEGRTFVSDFKSSFGHDPFPQAVFGYEAMSALLAVLDEAGAEADDRATVVSDFRSLKVGSSAIGTYKIVGGDPTIAPFIFAHVRGGALVPFKFVQLQG
ncbi:MAG: ABC transporter substrate-binding protein [Solirubrobacteraceae bacterium]